ncbi:Na+/H+ antiporter NhaA [Microbacterium sediminis]|uniref:Na(+)/H(+) antiporter NhaA n=1 Tax=Microbacterium sediminis TaxID=904291 RepID=A0A1B9NJ16_9MICO|nr:Na+/H+ antiporter NhaA [Microbacterium sediminis]OCG76597.1 sodium:proton antiporter [Microbacterium sediminis]QBR73798.1 Na+/H+ antiporter NhaA [Microbacterium sediminis]
MKLLRSERFPAFLLLGAAVLGLLVANLPFGGAVIEASHAHLAIPGTGLDLSIAHWVSDFLLAIFFFGAAIELVYEITSGQLNSVKRALTPAIAAAGGVIVPIAIYLLIAGHDPATAGGWPVPTATDIAFALGVLAMFGKGLPSKVRVFLLALAIIDDIVGIIFIAVLFAHDLDLGSLAIALVLVIAFAVVSRYLNPRNRAVLVPIMIVLGLGAWAFTYLGGIHATIAGVLLGVAIRQNTGMHARHVLEPWINGLILPVFAFFAALVMIPQVSVSELSPALWGILVALPVGKIIGISAAGWLAVRLNRTKGEEPAIHFADIVAAGALGGIGFTVSLLMANLAFADDPAIKDQAILGVLGGSLIALALSAVLVSWRAAHHRRLQREGTEPAEPEVHHAPDEIHGQLE